MPSYLKPWLIAAVVWGFLSMIIIVEYLKGGETKYVNQLWFLMSLLWAQFGVAALFNCLMKRHKHQFFPLSLVTVLPPFILYIIVHLMVGVLKYVCPAMSMYTA
jgi:hypothetical protein